MSKTGQPDSASAARPLFERFPALSSQLPFIALGELPTPVNRLVNLQQRLGLEELWVKRDDLSAPTYGGNKIRKLEFLLADALQKNCGTVVTFGGLGSNHALATSLNCRQLGLKSVAILTPEPATDAVRRTLRYHLLLGTEIRIANRYADTRTIADMITAERGAQEVYEVPFGGSSWRGTTGFVNAALELDQQVTAGLLPAPDVIYLGLGTAGSVAGLALGLRLLNRSTQIQAVQVTPDSVRPGSLCERLYVETLGKLRALDTSIPAIDPLSSAVTVRKDQLGEGYAIPTMAAKEAAQLMSEEESMNSSLTYTAKTMAALIADARAGLLSGKRALFWNTYNSRPYPELPEDDSWKKLPPELHFMFDQ